MKTLGSTLLLVLVVVASLREIPMQSLWSEGGSQRVGSFVGQIMDSKCAITGLHETNMKRLNAKDARECTLKCAKDASFVLYDPGSKTVYQLNDQEKPMRFAGEKVRISGVYDDWSQTIAIESIEPAS